MFGSLKEVAIAPNPDRVIIAMMRKDSIFFIDGSPPLFWVFDEVSMRCDIMRWSRR